MKKIFAQLIYVFRPNEITFSPSWNGNAPRWKTAAWTLYPLISLHEVSFNHIDGVMVSVFEWSAVSNCGLLFQWASDIIIQL